MFLFLGNSLLPIITIYIILSLSLIVLAIFLAIDITASFSYNYLATSPPLAHFFNGTTNFHNNIYFKLYSTKVTISPFSRSRKIISTTTRSPTLIWALLRPLLVRKRSGTLALITLPLSHLIRNFFLLIRSITVPWSGI